MADIEYPKKGFNLISPDYDLLLRLTHALLMVLPRRIQIDADTHINICRADDPDNLPEGEDPALSVSPLFIDKEHMRPEILIEFDRKGKFESLFRIQLGGGVLVREGLTVDDILPAVADPCDNPL